MRNIKISIRLFIITIALLLFIQLPTFATTGKSTVSNLRIRKTPSTDGEVIDVLGLEDKVEILGEQGDWYNISFKKVNGYVSKTYITTDEDTKENNNSEGNSAQNQENNNSDANNTTEQTNGNEQNSNGNNEENNNTSESANSNQQEVKEEKPVNKVFKIAEKTQVTILPLLTSEIIGEVDKDENVNLINNAGLWAYIQTNKYSGWIRIDKLSTENVNVDNTDTTNNNSDNNQNTTSNVSKDNNQNVENNNNNDNNSQTNYSPKTMYAKSSGINVRSESNTSSEVVTSIGINAEVKVVGEENGWYKVEVDGSKGYIRNDLLSNEKVEVSSRSNDIDRSATNENTNLNNANTNNTTNNTNNNTNNDNTQQETTSSNSVPVSSSGVSGNDIVEYAKQFLGCRYVYGAAGPSSFDCSGLTMYVYKHFGYSLSHSSRVQATQGKAVTGELQPGDILVFTNGGSTVGHVGIYIGNDKFIHASDSTTGVIISNLSDRWNKSKYVGARRIL